MNCPYYINKKKLFIDLLLNKEDDLAAKILAAHDNRKEMFFEALLVIDKKRIEDFISKNIHAKYFLESIKRDFNFANRLIEEDNFKKGKLRVKIYTPIKKEKKKRNLLLTRKSRVVSTPEPWIKEVVSCVNKRKK